MSATREGHPVLLVGDSLLAQLNMPRIERLQANLGGQTVLNCAAGGATAQDALRCARDLVRLTPSGVILSAGLNDIAPRHRSPIAEIERAVSELLDLYAPAKLLVLVPPYPDPQRQASDRRRLPQDVNALREALRQVAERHGASCVDVEDYAAQLRAASSDPHADDGLHLSDAMYDRLLGAFAPLLN